MPNRQAHEQSGRARLLAERWGAVSSRYLPITEEGTPWRYSCVPAADAPEQGWKLHVTATILTAARVLERIGPYLHDRQIPFKGPRTLEHLSRINSGLYYGYPQVGKCFTIYPAHDSQCLEVAQRLHQLTADLHAPGVPFDGHFCASSSIYYRYGSFKRRTVPAEDGSVVPAISDRKGKLVPDLRMSLAPEWVKNPFGVEEQVDSATESQSPIGSTIRIFRAISQRGKGGVYHAADLSGAIPRQCVLKEGRRFGEVSINGRDGYSRIRHERSVLKDLRRNGIDVPRILGSFAAENNFYLVLEYLEGRDLQSFLEVRKRRLPVITALRFAIQVARIIAEVQAAGWVWRDCKPSNFILTAGNRLRPIDFESACRIGKNSVLDWGSKSFLPPGPEEARPSHPAVDRYALGIVIYYLLAGRFPDPDDPVPVGKRRRGIPHSVELIVGRLMHRNPDRRPSAHSVVKKLESVVASLELSDHSSLRFARMNADKKLLRQSLSRDQVHLTREHREPWV